MNYQAIYAAFIDDRRTKEAALKDSGAYSERHHIIPRAHAGDDSAENLIRLTPEDHFFAHLLLAKIHGGSMWQALMIMSRRGSQRNHCEGFVRRSRKHYGYAKRKASEVYSSDFYKRLAEGRGPMDSAEARAKVSAALKGRKFSAEVRAKISATKTGVKLSDATRAKMSAFHTGRKRTPEQIEACRQGLIGLKKSPEHIEKMRANATGKRASPEQLKNMKAASARRINKQPNLGNNHSEETKKRMSEVYEAKRVYSKLHGVSPKIITIVMIEAAGIRIGG